MDTCMRELSLLVWVSWLVSSSIRDSNRLDVVGGRGPGLSDFVSRSTIRKFKSLTCFSRLA